MEEDDFEENIPIEPKSKQGQLYRLGRHYLMCGDSTSEADVEKLTKGCKIDLCVTDPPYNVDYEAKDKALEASYKRNQSRKVNTISNDKMSDEQFEQFAIDTFRNMERVLKNGGAFYIWHASRTQSTFERALNIVGLEVRQQLVWNKNCMVIGRQDYQWKHEPCFYGWKEGAAHYFVDSRNLTTVYEDEKPNIKQMKKDELVELLEQFYADNISTTVINEDKPAKSDLHPTMKPIKLIARQIQNSSKPDETVIDFFGGSGSTMMACEQTKRTCYTMEYDPRYVDVIIERWEKFTGMKAELLSE